MKDLIYPVLFFGAIVFFFYIIGKSFLKQENNIDYLEKEKKYLFKCLGKLKIVDADSLYSPYNDVIIFIYDTYLIAISPKMSTPLHNTVFYKTKSQLKNIKLEGKCKILSSEFIDDELVIYGSVNRYTELSFSYQNTYCYFKFENITDNLKNAILKFL